MKLDALLHGVPREVAGEARRAERLGYAGVWVAETAHNPFLALWSAAEATGRLELATGIAVAFPRSPMITAQAAWDLQARSGGRFHLGLGSQVRAHIARRFSATWDRPVARMREYVLALRAIWDAFQNGRPLRFEGEFYRHTLLTPFFNPGPIEHPRIPVFVAAVGPKMTEMGGEVADGILLHAFTNEAWFTRVTLPALERGLRKGGRRRSQVVLARPFFLITGEGAQREAMEQEVRRQIAFYGSTPAYAGVLEVLGQGDLHRELHRLSREGRWEAMGRLLPEEVVDAFAVRCDLAELPRRLQERFGGSYDRVVAYAPLPGDDETVARIVKGCQGSRPPLR